MGSGTVAMVGVNVVELAMVKFVMVGTKCVPPTTPWQGNNGRSSGQNIVTRANISCMVFVLVGGRAVGNL